MGTIDVLEERVAGQGKRIDTIERKLDRLMFLGLSTLATSLGGLVIVALELLSKGKP